MDQLEPQVRRRPRIVAAASPVAGIAAFFGLMTVAIARFPGGNRFHPEAAGFGFFANFWCDLFDEKTYAGAVNAGRGYAVAASLILFSAMVPLWWELPKTFVATPRLVRPTQICGTVSMLGATLVPTVLHDLAIVVAGPLGAAAYLFMLLGLRASGRRRLAALGLLPLALATVNFLLWITAVAVPAIPAVQKLALLAFVAWTFVLAGSQLRAAAGRGVESR